jgi:hypothetical protein
MSEANNPFQSPLSIPETQQSIPAIKTVRRIAGIVAYLGAGLFGFDAAVEAFWLAYGFLHPESGLGRNRMLAIPLGLTALLGWSGYRLRHRPKGVIEWVIVSLFVLMVIMALLAAVVIELTPEE